MPQPLPTPSEAAQAAFEEARHAVWRAPDGATAWRALERAQSLAPTWAVPARLADDLRGGWLQGPAALRERWQQWQNAGTAAEKGLAAYLMGRPLGIDEGRWFDRATQTSPGDPWGWHGLAFEARREQRSERAQRLQKRALRLAREPVEFGLFSAALARLQAGANDIPGALGTLEHALQTVTAESDRLDLEWQWIQLAARSGQAEWESRARTLARELCRRSDLPLRLWAELLETSWLPTQEVAAYALQQADPDVRRLALGFLGAEAATLRSSLEPEWYPVTRIERFGQGQCVEAVEEWLAQWPAFLQPHGEHGVDLTPWTELLEACRRWQADPKAGAAAEVAQQLLAVGWFAEAQAFVRSWPKGLEGEDALWVEARAGLLRTSLMRLNRMLAELDRGEARYSDPKNGRERVVRDLEGLLRATGQVLLEAGLLQPTEADALVASPRLRFGQFAQVVHPGPIAAPWDAPEFEPGTPIPGLADALGRIGRVGIFGAALGVPPDATILRLIGHETIEGEHLGIPFHGTVLWCDGSDVGARAMRLGGSVAGAALHEGYYVDVGELRDNLVLWDRWAQNWQDPFVREQLQRGLEDPGLPVAFVASLPPAPESTSPVFRPQPEPWLSTDWLLGQADRVRLSLLLERGEGDSLGRVTLDEVARVTAIHEEGHLMERTRFLPLGKNWPAVLAFAAAEGFSPMGIQERLEYRAQLVALCVVPEPRLVLVDILDQAQTRGSGLPHAAGYKELLGDLLRVLADAANADAPWLQGWRPDRQYLLSHQLHRVPPEVLRAAGLQLAEATGLSAKESAGEVPALDAGE